MTTTRGRTLIFAGAIGGLLLASGAVAFAAIPNPTTGVISGCYTNSTPHVLRVIDTVRTSKCPSGTTAINWNQTGPQGIQGPAGGVSGETYVQNEVEFQAGQTPPILESGTAYCPSGDVATGGGYGISGSMGIGGEATERWIPVFDYAVTSSGVPHGWVVSLDETGTAGNPQLNYILNVFVYCAPGS